MNPCWNQIGIWGNSACPELRVYIHCRNCHVYQAAGRQLLERPVSTDYLRESADTLSHVKEEAADAIISVSIFRIGEEWLALPTACFKEVTEVSPVHTLPHCRNKILLGLVSVRGEIQICISLGQLLGLAPSAPSYNRSVYQRMIVAQQGSSRWVFAVDELAGVYRIPTADLHNVPATVSKAIGTYTKAIIRLRDKSVSYLDDELLFYSLRTKVV